MKTIFNILLVCAIAGLTACGGAADADHDADKAANDAAPEMMEKTGITETDGADATLVEHVCNDKCTADAHNNICGEKGHTCSGACHAGDKEASLKDHVCNDQCTADAHHTTCGEKGHACTAACHASEGHDHAAHS